jgi:hypothetical protein
MSCIEPHMKESLKDHVLVPVLPHKGAWASFYLRKPGEGRMMSCLITFTPEGIVIQGDLTPGRNGNVSVLGYGLDWFAGQLSEDYLCEKFLERRFSRERTVQAIKETILEKRRQGDIGRLDARLFWNELRDDPEAGEEGLYNFISERLDGDGEDMRQDYNKGEAGWLCAIQQRFSALYHAQEGR